MNRTTGSSPPAARPVIAVVGPHPESRGGVAATVRALADVFEGRYEVIVLPTQVDGDAASKLRTVAVSLRALERLCRRGEVDLVHVHASAGISFARKAVAAGIARLHGVPVVVHVHGGAFRAQLQGSGVRGWLGRRVLRTTLEAADAVIALTPGWAADLQGFARIARIRVVPNAPDLVLPDAEGSSERDGSRTVLYLGHLYRDKGVYELVEAFSGLRAEREGLRLVLAGEGREREELAAYARGLGLNGSIRFAGWVGPEEKARLLRSAECLVLPSYHEGLPLAVLEAMTAGVPVVATAVGGIPEVARDGREALLVEPRDVDGLRGAIARVLDDAQLAESLAQAARRRALDEFSPTALARRVGDLYDEVLRER